jgi:hypothetical protein
MKLDLADYLAFVDYHEREWALLDQTLHRLCNEHPYHSDSGAVHAKLWLIGRSFATGVERHIKSTGTQGSSLTKMATHLLQEHEAVDALFQQVRQLNEPLNLDSLARIVAIHGTFCELVSRIAHGGKVLVSFASKYMHLHAPIVPIYDSWASKQAWRMRRSEGLKSFPTPAGANENYYGYCLCFWQHYSDLRAMTDRVTVRHAESYLLWLAGSQRASDQNEKPPQGSGH